VRSRVCPSLCFSGAPWGWVKNAEEKEEQEIPRVFSRGEARRWFLRRRWLVHAVVAHVHMVSDAAAAGELLRQGRSSVRFAASCAARESASFAVPRPPFDEKNSDCLRNSGSGIRNQAYQTYRQGKGKED